MAYTYALPGGSPTLGPMPAPIVPVPAATPAVSPQAAQLAASLGQAGMEGLASGGTLLGAGIGAGIAGLSWSGKKHRELLKKDVAKLEAGKLGWSKSKKRQYLGEAMLAAEAQAAPVEAELTRARNAVGFGRAGVQTDQFGVVQQTKQTGAAQAVVGAEALSQQQVLASAADIKARVAAQRKKVAKDWRPVMGGVAGIAGTVAGIGIGNKAIQNLTPTVETPDKIPDLPEIGVA